MNEYISPFLIFSGVYIMAMVQAITTRTISQGIFLQGIPTVIGVSLLYIGFNLWGLA